MSEQSEGPQRGKAGEATPTRSAVWRPGDGSEMEGLLAEARLSAWAFPKIFERGKDYAAEGRVMDLKLGKLRVRARVVGGGEQAYQVSIDAQEGPKGVELISLECDCPWAEDARGDKGACKHAIAAGLAAGRAYAIEREAAIVEREMAPATAPRKPSSRI